MLWLSGVLASKLGMTECSDCTSYYAATVSYFTLHVSLRLAFIRFLALISFLDMKNRATANKQLYKNSNTDILLETP